ncbi:hypothetical protein Droror1_Dr00028056 [Drosera rotundifolia]
MSLRALPWRPTLLHQHHLRLLATNPTIIFSLQSETLEILDRRRVGLKGRVGFEGVEDVEGLLGKAEDGRVLGVREICGVVGKGVGRGVLSIIDNILI